MAKNVLSLQLLRNSQIVADKAAAISAIQANGTNDGVIKLARYYTDETSATTKTIFGVFHDFGSNNTGYTIYDADHDKIAAIEAKIGTGTTTLDEVVEMLGSGFDSGHTVADAIKDINDKLGNGVGTGAGQSVTNQLEALSGTAGASSAETSVAGAKAYTDDKIAKTLDGLDYAGATTGDGKVVVNVTEADGIVSGHTAEVGGLKLTDYTQGSASGAVAATDTINQAFGKVENQIAAINADAATYTIRKDTAGLPATVKERYTLVETKNGTSTDKQVSIDIPKDSHIVSINYISTSGDPHYQNLEYVYVTDSGTTSTTYVDMSALVLEAEFASGVTATNHVVHGVVDPTSEEDSSNNAFLTVGENGFKVDGIKAEINNAVSDATAQTAALSAKTVTEVGSSNSSIAATLSAATDGTKHLDVITDASKIKMSGFTSTDVLSGITSSSSITEAFKEVDAVITANEEVTAKALNDLEARKLENIVVNGKTGTVASNTATVTIDGADITLDGYQKPAAATAITSTDTVNQAIGKLEKGLEAATSGGITGATVNNAHLAVTNNVLTQTVAGKQSEATATNNEAIVVETDANGNLTLGLANIDAGVY